MELSQPDLTFSRESFNDAIGFVQTPLFVACTNLIVNRKFYRILTILRIVSKDAVLKLKLKWQ